jgi:trans-aconitate methyltransferase
MRQFVELIGGRWWALFGGLGETLRTGEPRTLPFDFDPGSTEKFGKAMKSRTESTRGAVEHPDLSRARVVVDVGGGFGHLAIALLERYPHLRASVLDRPEVVEVAERHVAAVDARESIIEGIHA